MTRDEYRALPVDEATRVAMLVVDHRGPDRGLSILKEATEGRLDFDWVRPDIQAVRRGSMLERVHDAGPEAVGVVVRELVLDHPDGEAVLAELAQQREERVGVLIDRLLADLDELPDVPAVAAAAGGPLSPATAALSSGRLRRLLGRG